MFFIFYRFKFFVYSAYFDDRISGSNVRRNDVAGKEKTKTDKQSGLIRIIGATKTRAPERVWCRLWYRHRKNGDNITLSVTVAAKVKVIRENWNLKYSACFVICPLPNESPITGVKDSLMTITVPETVSVVAKLGAQPTNRLLIQNRPDDRPRRRENLAICIKPLHYNYNRVRFTV